MDSDVGSVFAFGHPGGSSTAASLGAVCALAGQDAD
jgi:hypothetical protein